MPDSPSNAVLNPGHDTPSVPGLEFYAMDSTSGHDSPSVPGPQFHAFGSSQGSTPVQAQAEEEISPEVPATPIAQVTIEDAPVPTVTQERRERFSLIAEFIQAARE